MTTPTKCERCGQVDCPMLAKSYDGDREWIAAFQACGTMRGAVAQEEANVVALAQNELLFDIRYVLNNSTIAKRVRE